jgi:hypothetical protein
MGANLGSFYFRLFSHHSTALPLWLPFGEKINEKQIIPDLLSSPGPELPDAIFSKPKIPIWVHFGGSCIGRCWYIYFMAKLVYKMVIWYIL